MPDTPEMRSFEIRKKPAEGERVIPFKLDGDEYHLYPDRLNGFVVLDLGTMDISQDSRPMWEFFEGLLGPDYSRFRKYLRGPDIDIEADEVKDLIQWMIETTAAVPTERSSS